MKKKTYEERVSLLNPQAPVQLATHNALADLRPSLVALLGNYMEFMQFKAQFHKLIMQTPHYYEAPRR